MSSDTHDALVRLRHIFAIMSGATPASGNEEYWDGDILWITPEDLNDKDNYWLADTHRKITRSGYDSSGTTLAPPNSIALSKRAPIGHLALLQKPACSNQGCFLLVPSSKVEARFYYYHLSSRIEWLQALGSGSTFMELGIDALKSLRIPLPPLPRQRAIADRLDRETGRLDALVAAKRRLLELLAEKRRALIAYAVTRGLEPGVRDSGGFAVKENGAATVGDGGVAAVAEWSQHRLKHLVTINDEVLEEDTDHDTEVQYIDIGNVDSLGHIQEPVTYRFEDAPSRARRRVRDGDVIISTVRTYLQAITQIHDPPDNLVVSTGFAVVRPLCDRLDSRYCKFALREASFLAEIEKRSVGVSYPAINASDLANIPINVPPLSQQRAIADHLDRETGRLDALAGRTRESVALLRERRAALISAAVGGRGPVVSG